MTDTRGCTGSRGFTLIELLIVLTLSGIVALLVYGAVDVGRETEARITSRRSAAQGARGFHVVVGDALRNAARPTGPSQPIFVLDHRVTGGRPADRLAVLTSGATAPLTPGWDWTVTLAPTPDGITLTARAVGAPGEPITLGILPGIAGLDVRVLGPGGRWSDSWPAHGTLPAAVEITYWDSAGPAGPPVRVALALGTGGP